MFVFWFNTFFIDMHLLQQQQPNATSRSSHHHHHHHKTTSDNGSVDHRSPSTSSDQQHLGTAAAIALSKMKGHQRHRSDTPLGSGGKPPKSHNSKRAMSPSTSKSVYHCLS